MPWILPMGSAVALLAAALLNACSPRPCGLPTTPSAVPVLDGGLGDPCGNLDGTCGSGLSCLDPSYFYTYPTLTCTVDCAADAGCPSGSSCFHSGGLPNTSVCLPTCTTRSDCLTTRAATCVPYLDAGVCEALLCEPPGGALPGCPAGYTCVGFHSCGCNVAQPCQETSGWCERGVDGG
jgi:hypothetical protein